MPDLERNLRALASELDWPPTPPLELRLEPRRRWRPRPLIAVLVAAVIAIAVAFSVPGARSAILRFFDLGGVTVERVAVLPPAEERSLAAGLGPLVTPSVSAAALGAPVRLPPLSGRPRLHLRDGVVSLLLASPEPVLLSEFRTGGYVLKKIAGLATTVTPVTIGDAPGLWISGQQHIVFMPSASPRLAGNVLVWQSRGILYRLEGQTLSKQDALRLASGIQGT